MSETTLLSPAQRAFLEDRHYAVIATLNADGSLQQSVVWYLLEGETIRFSIGDRSTKARNLRRHPQVAVTIEASTRYLTISGEATVESVDPALRLRLARRYVGPERADEWVARRPDAPRASVRVKIVRVYGQGV